MSQYKQKTQHPSHHLHTHTTYFNTPRLNRHYLNNGRNTTNIPTDPHTVTTTDIQYYYHIIRNTFGANLPIDFLSFIVLCTFIYVYVSYVLWFVCIVSFSTYIYNMQ